MTAAALQEMGTEISGVRWLGSPSSPAVPPSPTEIAYDPPEARRLLLASARRVIGAGIDPSIWVALPAVRAICQLAKIPDEELEHYAAVALGMR